MQIAKQVRDPPGHCVGYFGSRGQLTADSCLDFFHNQVLAR
jgi:hypothetical protein